MLRPDFFPTIGIEYAKYETTQTTLSDKFRDEVVGHQPAADEFEYRAGHESYKRPPTRLQRKAGILSVYQFKDNRPEERSQHDTPRSEEETNEQA